jgi:hypothetical protein
MSIAAEHDYIGRVREEIGTLEADLKERGARDDLAKVARQLDLPDDLALAAIYRAARRSGLSLRLMLTELANQFDKASRPGA